ncbi:HIT-like protein [Cystobasidium minutum MCA 4210]|uniref:HIT-like protein n=1 Tax=Cystobasidium minutum MCA 4210 TaxID=1397322 RepID=UPI0034CF2733|eukprot:jgi/Rhomi1/175177/fgenesh1_kg.9_\
MLSIFRSCLGLDRQADPPTPTKAKQCIFCNVTSERGFNVVYEDDKFTVFTDRSPGARLHLLCVPKEHIDNVKTLARKDVPMLNEMQAIGHRLLNESGFEPNMQRLGFHIPPFFSVNHLHLHILGLPTISWKDGIKYKPSIVQPGSNKHKGFSHFVELNQAISILESGKRVGVLSV